MIKASFKIVTLLLFLTGCGNINPANNEPGNKLQGDSISGTGIIESPAFQIPIIDSLIKKQGKVLDSLEKIQEKTKNKTSELTKRIAEEAEKYNTLCERREKLFFAH